MPDQQLKPSHQMCSDANLLSDLKLKTTHERQLTLEIIQLLEEVDRRRLFLKMGYGSLIEFCIHELKYSESAAYRRIAAMRVVRDVPQAKEKISDGTLTLAVVARAQTFFNASAKHTGVRLAPEQKAEVLLSLEGQNSRDAEKTLLQTLPIDLPSEHVRMISSTHSELRTSLTNETLQNLDRLRDLLGHKMPGANYADIIEQIAEMALQKLDPLLKAARATGGVGSTAAPGFGSVVPMSSGSAGKGTEGRSSITKPAKSTPTPVLQSAIVRKVIPAHLKREVWRKAGGQCCYIESQSGRRCSSRYMLEIDHVVSIARGGLNSSENLQLRCRAHNSWKGVGKV